MSRKGKKYYDNKQTGENQESSGKENSRNKNEKRGGNKGNRRGDSSFGAPKAQLLTDVARVSFENALGRVEDLTDGTTPNLVTFKDTTSPGVAAIHFVPMYGIGKVASDAYNIAANVLYTEIRFNKSGTAKYTAPDLMMYFAGADSMFSYWAFLVRTYGLLSTYSAKNWYYPRALVEASGFNFDNLMKNLANLREYINQYALRLSIYHVPNNIPIFSRHIELLSKVFMDNESDKAQSFIYVPEGFYQFDETGSSTGGRLLFKPFLSWKGGMGTPKGMNEIIEYGDALYNAMNKSEDMNIIMADVRYAFDASASISPVLIDAQYRVIPEYNTDVLAMIHNATINGGYGEFAENSFDITQDGGTNTLKCTPIKAITIGEGSDFPSENAVVDPALNKKFLDVRDTTMDAAGVMMITRQQTNGKLRAKDGTMVPLEYTATGPEFITDIDIVNRNKAGGLIYTTVDPVYLETDIGRVIGDTIPFYHFPFVYAFKTNLGTLSTNVRPVGMIDNYSSIDSERLERMHITNWAYQYNIPTDNLV